MIVTVSDMLTAVRDMSNTERSQFVSDDEIVRYIDRGYRELYDVLTTSYENYNIAAPYTITTTSGTDIYNLPADFYKLIGVDLNIDPNRSITLRPFMISERNRYRSGLFSPIVPGVIYQYHVWGNQIRFIPTPSAQQANIVLWYIPIPKKLVVTVTDIATQIASVDIINGYDEFITISAVIKVLSKMEQDTKTWERKEAEFKQNIVDSAANRDTGMPERVADATSNYWPMAYPTTGIGW